MGATTALTTAAAKRSTRRVTTQGVAHYLDAVARHVGRGDEVLILGPGETKRALARRIGRIKSLIGVTTKEAAADKISDADLVATIRKRYRLPV